MSALQNYIRALQDARTVGVKETSGYGALQTLLDAVGQKLKPPVRCILHPSGTGAGIPDGGLFTREQLQPLKKDFDPQKALQMTPARGAIEVKGTADDLQQLIKSDQVKKYLAKYRKVLCTNYREFALLEQQGDHVREVDSFSFAKKESEFWTKAAKPAELDKEEGERFTAFLERALLFGAPLATPEAVAAYMASCAREAKLRIAAAYEAPALDQIRHSLEQALNVSFKDHRAEVFFESSLVQTLFYGVFSAWILWGRDNPPSSGQRFDWRLSAYYLKVPAIQNLFHQLTDPQIMQTLDVIEPLNWVGDALNRVDRASFDASFKDGSAVQYFYEPFLAAYDPELRKQLGVWYTPVEIVKYMVARVDHVLETELGLPGGLANERVVVLDPCCGTGGYLVEVLKRIEARLKENGDDALAGFDLKKAALERVFGFELLTAPFVVSHLQLGLLLQSLGAPLAGQERAQIFLTNALTGWSKPDGDQKKIDLPGLEQEREAAAKIKRHEKILVILGNPPYDGFAGIAMGEERELSNAYRTPVDPNLPKPEGHGLNELYVRFFRMAERKITEDTGEGIVCYISNYSWLDGKSHPAMREAYLNRFDKIWIDNLNGDRYRTGKVAPDGSPDPSVFSTESNREGIQVGAAVTLMARRQKHEGGAATLRYRELWGTSKRQHLVTELKGTLTAEYVEIEPRRQLGFPFVVTSTARNYSTWPELPDLLPRIFPGVKTSRDEVVVDFDQERLVVRMRAYFDPNITDEELRILSPKAINDGSRFEGVKVRRYLQQRGFLPGNIVHYAYRPLDVRWLYWEPETKLLDEKRTEYFEHVFPGNLAMVSQQISRRTSSAPQAISSLGCIDLMDRSASIFPLYLRDQTVANLFAEEGEIPKKPNLSPLASTYLTQLNAEPEALFYHALAIQHAPAYRRENADALRLDWPRIPLPASDEVLETSSALGHLVAALLDPLQPVDGVTKSLRPELKPLGTLAKSDGGQIDPAAGELAVNANWGYRDTRGAVMAGQGKSVERDWTSNELAALEEGGAVLGLDLETVLRHLGQKAVDVYLNDSVYWRAVPGRVWDYTLGGYRVMKKWLSYRESDLLGRDLKPDEAREVTAMVRRIAALLLLEPQLDANYAASAAHTWSDNVGP